MPSRAARQATVMYSRTYWFWAQTVKLLLAFLGFAIYKLLWLGFPVTTPLVNPESGVGSLPPDTSCFTSKTIGTGDTHSKLAAQP